MFGEGFVTTLELVPTSGPEGVIVSDELQVIGALSHVFSYAQIFLATHHLIIWEPFHVYLRWFLTSSGTCPIFMIHIYFKYSTGRSHTKMVSCMFCLIRFYVFMNALFGGNNIFYLLFILKN